MSNNFNPKITFLCNKGHMLHALEPVSHVGLWNNSQQQNCPWEANGRSVIQEITLFYGTLESG
jgi:hypothetical protein